jgi:cytochrome bd-type quinol oxidase subunit 2
MAKHYKEAPWWWYATVLVVSFILGLIVALKENITLPVWAYIVSLVVGIIVAPFVSRPKSVVSDISVYGAALTQSTFSDRVPSCTLATATALPPTTCRKCWRDS